MKKPQIPHYHGQRFLLIFLELLEKKLSKMDFQKLLFLSQQETDCAYYDFVPYFYGCYSFQAQADIDLLESAGWLETTETSMQLLEKPSIGLIGNEREIVSRFVKKYQDYRGKELIRHVYESHPYYAIHSMMAKDVLNKQSYEVVVHAEKKLKSNTKKLFTIGYEGISFEKYINQLICNNVRLLCDVRNNPLSRKFGFSKNILARLLPKIGVEYIHLPELGIISANRNHLEAKADYAQLFKTYKKNLPQKKESLEMLVGLLAQYNRVALTCFEKQHDSCHRHCISEYIEDTSDIKVVHL
ncbi:MAG: DUF488 domain-containing protein [Deltaproteobacteria bacterium]|nr:DUF488 domain-containing protein [Deltaproteobacteria bacterium]